MEDVGDKPQPATDADGDDEDAVVCLSPRVGGRGSPQKAPGSASKASQDRSQVTVVEDSPHRPSTVARPIGGAEAVAAAAPGAPDADIGSDSVTDAGGDDDAAVVDKDRTNAAVRSASSAGSGGDDTAQAGPPPLDVSSLMCPHGKLAPLQVDNTVLIPRTAVDWVQNNTACIIKQRFNGSAAEACCQECVQKCYNSEHERVQLSKDQVEVEPLLRQVSQRKRRGCAAQPMCSFVIFHPERHR